MTFHSFETGGIGTRRLRYAVIASLLLHLLLLWPTAPRLLTDTAPALLHAALRPSPVPSQPPPPPKPAPRTVVPAPTVAAPSAPVAPQALEPSKPASVPQTPVVSAEKALTPMPPPASPARTVAPSVPARPTAPGAVTATLISEATASGAVLDGLRGYRLAVASQARRFKRYPAQAMAAGWAGSAEIRLEVSSDGQPRDVTLSRSSGHELLDRAAQAMIDAGAQRASVPESLRGKAFAVVLPVVFNLEGD
ncbi:MAG: TonB family protein [Sulfuritalea sp.]|nr:TonB family protein [Sulfuritalea sp.]